jgi:hypothetical protein
MIGDKVLYNNRRFPGGEPITIGTAWLKRCFAAGASSGQGWQFCSFERQSQPVVFAHNDACLFKLSTHSVIF